MSSSYAKHAPKHRAPAQHRAARVSRAAAVKTSLTLSSMAVVATGIAVGTGSVSMGAITADHDSSTTPVTAAVGEPVALRGTQPAATSSAADSGAGTGSRTEAGATLDSAAKSYRPQVVSRSDRRSSTDRLKQDTLALGTGNTMSKSENLTGGDPRTIAQALLSSFGWSQSQFGCLDSLWTRESNWNLHAENRYSGAYGIPQALPGSKMASAGADWQNNAETQIKWGLGYIAERYGSPCGAWAHSEGHGWY